MSPRRATTRAERRELIRENAKLPAKLTQIPLEQLTQQKPPGLIEVWRSRRYLVQVYQHGAHTCITCCRTEIGPDHSRWKDGISWDELQRIKGAIGRGNEWAVEIFPPDRDLVNVANMRHLWIMDGEQLPFAWRSH